MPQKDSPVLHNDVRFTLALVRAARHRRHDVPIVVRVDDDSILGQLFLNQNHLLRTPDDEVSTGIEGAFAWRKNGELFKCGLIDFTDAVTLSLSSKSMELLFDR